MDAKLDTSVQYIKGVGEKRAAAFKKLGVHTLRELFYLFPRAYEDWQTIYPIDAAPADETLCIKAVVCSQGAFFNTKSGGGVFKTAASDGFSEISLVFFNNPYAAAQLKPGAEFLFYGKIKAGQNGKKEMASPKYAKPSDNMRLRPIYPQTAALSTRTTERVMKTAIELYIDLLPDCLPSGQREKYRLMSESEALRAIHFPASREQLRLARRSLSYEELLILQLGLLAKGAAGTKQTQLIINKDLSKEFERLLPFSLTGGQKKAVAQCLEDMKSGFAMRRLLQGDVGSGKTAVAASLMYSTVKSGYQCALMAPTEILAQQHFKSISGLFKNSGIEVCLLTGSSSAKQKREIKSRLLSGGADIVIGTHAVITKDTQFKNAALFITDEQHRFGVAQRAALREKGLNPHLLVMSATPIPRTLSLIIYGDLSVSVLDEKPAGRKEIKTFHIPSLYHERMYGFIKKEAEKGHKSFIVCPLVEESDELSEKKAAEEYYTLLSSTVFKNYRSALLHGKLKPAEKDRIMREFSQGETQILFCTSVVEVGIDVPDATLIAIENAECFGLSQLHQLRGRVGRAKAQSYCILVSDAESAQAKRRMEIMCSTGNGFEIADEDLKMRGPGDFFGSRQSGLPNLKAANLLGDSRILFAAREEAQRLLSADKTLSLPENRFLKQKISALFADI